MNPGLVIKLRPNGPWRIGPDSGARNRVDMIYHSDSLYAAVTSAMARLGWMEEWLDATARQGASGVWFSSCFPFVDDLVFIVPPRTVWPPVSHSTKAASVRWKSARFVPLTVVQSVLARRRLDERQWTVDGPSDCLMPAGKPGPFRSAVRWNAGVDRWSGASERHSTACLEFRAGAGLWTVVAFEDEAARDRWQDPVKAAFRLLADSGFGGERSRGWGRAEAPEFTEGMLPDLILPAPEEPEVAEAAVLAPPVVEPMVVEPAKPVRGTEAEPITETTAPEPEGPAAGEPAPVSDAPPAEPEPEPAIAAETPVEPAPLETAAAPESAPQSTAPEPVPAADAASAPPTPVELEPAPVTEAPLAESASAPPVEAPAAEPEPAPVSETPLAESAPAPPQAAAAAESIAETTAPQPVPAASAPQAPVEPEPAAVTETPLAESSSAPPVEAPPSSEPAPVIAAPAAEPEPAPVSETPLAESASAPPVEPAAPAGTARAHWLLSLFTPAPADSVDWRRGDYTVLVRGGRIDSPVRSGELKKQIQMVAEGSVLYAESPPRGSAADVAPDGFAHAVFRAGFALAIPLPEVR